MCFQVVGGKADPYHQNNKISILKKGRSAFKSISECTSKNHRSTDQVPRLRPSGDNHLVDKQILMLGMNLAHAHAIADNGLGSV